MCLITSTKRKSTSLISRVGQNRIYAPYMTVYLVISLPKIPYMHRIYMVLANPTYILYQPVTFPTGSLKTNPHLLYLIFYINLLPFQLGASAPTSRAPNLPLLVVQSVNVCVRVCAFSCAKWKSNVTGYAQGAYQICWLRLVCKPTSSTLN